MLLIKLFIALVKKAININILYYKAFECPLQIYLLIKAKKKTLRQKSVGRMKSVFK